MIKVSVYKLCVCPVKSKFIKDKLSDFLKENGIVSEAFVEVAFVGEKYIENLAEKYLEEKGVVHNVLSFPESEVRGSFVNPEFEEEMLNLGIIVVCCKKALEEARREEKLIDEKVWELVKHGGEHLLGKHHS
jgi:probable rRNA maturation factor